MNRGVECRWRMKKSRFSTNYALWDDWWSVNKIRLSSTYVDNTKCRTPFIAADGHGEMQGISESSHDWCSVVNKLVRSKYVSNSKRRLRLHQPTVTLKRKNIIYLYALVNRKPK